MFSGDFLGLLEANLCLRHVKILQRMLGKLTFHITKLQLKLSIFPHLSPLISLLPDRVFLPNSCRTILYTQDSTNCCQTFHLGAVSRKSAPSWLDMSQYTCSTQKRLESSLACFWKYWRKYKANCSFVVLRTANNLSFYFLVIFYV